MLPALGSEECHASQAETSGDEMEDAALSALQELGSVAEWGHASEHEVDEEDDLPD